MIHPWVWTNVLLKTRGVNSPSVKSVVLKEVRSIAESSSCTIVPTRNDWITHSKSQGISTSLQIQWLKSSIPTETAFKSIMRTIHVWHISLHLLIFMVNVGKYTIHGWYGGIDGIVLKFLASLVSVLLFKVRKEDKAAGSDPRGAWMWHQSPNGWISSYTIAPENRPGPKRQGLYSNHPFLGANCQLLVSVTFFMPLKVTSPLKGLLNHPKKGHKELPGYPFSHNHGFVENYPVNERNLLLERPICHWTMSMGV